MLSSVVLCYWRLTRKMCKDEKDVVRCMALGVSPEIQLNTDGVDIGDTGDIGGIGDSSKLKNIDKTYIKIRLWVWGNDLHISLTCIRARLSVPRYDLHTDCMCFQRWIMLRIALTWWLNSIRAMCEIITFTPLSPLCYLFYSSRLYQATTL